MAKTFVSKVEQSQMDTAVAQRIIDNWQMGGPMAHNMVRFELGILSSGNAELAQEVYEYLTAECDYE